VSISRLLRASLVQPDVLWGTMNALVAPRERDGGGGGACISHGCPCVLFSYFKRCVPLVLTPPLFISVPPLHVFLGPQHAELRRRVRHRGQRGDAADVVIGSGPRGPARAGLPTGGYHLDTCCCRSDGTHGGQAAFVHLKNSLKHRAGRLQAHWPEANHSFHDSYPISLQIIGIHVI